MLCVLHINLEALRPSAVLSRILSATTREVSLSSKLHRSLQEVPSTNARFRLDISMHSLIISDQNHGGTEDVKMKAQLTGVHVSSDFSLSAGV